MCEVLVNTMSNLRIEILAPRTPQQVWREERLQSARWLGWDASAEAAPAARAPTQAAGRGLFATLAGLFFHGKSA